MTDSPTFIVADDHPLFRNALRQTLEPHFPHARIVEAGTLDEVSARLSTTSLRFLNWRVAHAGADAATEARAWLVRHGLVAR